MARVLMFILSLAVICYLSFAETHVHKASLKYHAPSGKFSFKSDGLGDDIAKASFSNSINQTGWAYLQLETVDTFPDSAQAYAAGLLEGNVTRDLIKMHWTNTMAGMCTKPYSKFCSRLSNFLGENLKWMKDQIQEDKTLTHFSPFWHQVELFLYQAAGLSDAVNGISRAPHTDVDPMGFFLFQVDGDIEDLESVLGDSKIHRPLGSGSCSALVKLLPGNKDLYVAQDTWTTFQSMLRILKVYNFPWKMSATNPDTIPGRVQSFSSYPGTLMSGDDYYLLSSGLVSMETTIGNSNPGLWSFVRPTTVLEGIRSVVANRLAKSGKEWVDTFSLLNSGTYNNEWMIVDYKRFRPGMKTLPPGVLTVLDQIPEYIETADLTDLLVQQGYFASYNVAYFPKIFNESGSQAMVDKYGDWFTHDKTPRALIFRRDHVKVKDLDSMTKLMRYNDFTHDPLSRCNCTPPYSAENAISARSDLNPVDGKYPFGSLGHRLHGGVDMKLTSFDMFQDLTFIAVGGPSWDQQPPFQWSRSDFNTTSHLGHPDLWKFAPISFNSTAIFGDGGIVSKETDLRVKVRH
ncbi:putative phospholipase B-like 2 [Littorina saxatilis]|uniref:Phospholipase B-like n=1 Tax=Littorina saxatilis TaxID=31220 RepID=A0AAN9FXW8_9CAEN